MKRGWSGYTALRMLYAANLKGSAVGETLSLILWYIDPLNPINLSVKWLIDLNPHSHTISCSSCHLLSRSNVQVTANTFSCFESAVRFRRGWDWRLIWSCWGVLRTKLSQWEVHANVLTCPQIWPWLTVWTWTAGVLRHIHTSQYSDISSVSWVRDLSLTLVHVDTHVPAPWYSALQQHCTIMHSSSFCLPLSPLPSPPPLSSLSFSFLVLIPAICFPMLGIWLFFMGMFKRLCAALKGSLCAYMLLCGCRCPETVFCAAKCVCTCMRARVEDTGKDCATKACTVLHCTLYSNHSISV